MEGYISEIRMFAGNFAPGAWNFCDGSLQSIAVYTALFSLIGTTYGGDGQTTFALPDFRGRIPIGTGQGPGLSNYNLGQTAGSESMTMTVDQMPSHTHPSQVTFNIPASTAAGTTANPNDTTLANLTGAYSQDPSDVTLLPFNNSLTIGVVGASIPFNIMQPYLALNYIICMEGIYPSRN